MRYFIDFEFIEGFKKPLFGKKRHFIDMISVGIVCEDGREYYSVSTEFNPKDADDWVRENVIAKLPDRNLQMAGPLSPKGLVKGGYVWKSNEETKNDILTMFGCWRDQHFWRAPEGIEVYGYYSDYDWVLLCSLFGRMIDLPKGFPMYCIDLKQTLDERAAEIDQLELTHYLFEPKADEIQWQITGPVSKSVHSIDDYSLEMKLGLLKSRKDYPKNNQEHNALADAKWNYELYKLLKQ